MDLEPKCSHSHSNVGIDVEHVVVIHGLSCKKVEIERHAKAKIYPASRESGSTSRILWL